MGSWKGINEGSWSFKGDKIYGYGGGMERTKLLMRLTKKVMPFLTEKYQLILKSRELP